MTVAVENAGIGAGMRKAAEVEDIRGEHDIAIVVYCRFQSARRRNADIVRRNLVLRYRIGDVTVLPLVEVRYRSCRRDRFRKGDGRRRGNSGLGYRNDFVVPVRYALIIAVFKFRDRFRAVARDEHEIRRIPRREIRSHAYGIRIDRGRHGGSFLGHIDIVIARCRSLVIDVSHRAAVVVNVRNVVRPFPHRLTVVVLRQNAVHRIIVQIRRTACKGIDKSVDIYRGLRIACPRLE